MPLPALNPGLLYILYHLTWTFLLVQEGLSLDFKQINSYLALRQDNSFALLYENHWSS